MHRPSAAVEAGLGDHGPRHLKAFRQEKDVVIPVLDEDSPFKESFGFEVIAVYFENVEERCFGKVAEDGVIEQHLHHTRPEWLWCYGVPCLDVRCSTFASALALHNGRAL